MDRIAEWRPVEPAGPDGTVDSGASQSPPVQPGSDTSAANRRLLGAVVVGLAVAIGAVAGAIALIVLASAPKSAVSIDGQASPASSGLVASGGTEPTAAVGEVIIDVEGAVNESGLFRLALGSRIGDAIAAAGGYSVQVDIDAVTSRINLAALLTDGQQIHVPLRGEASPAPLAGGASGTPSAGGGPIDINAATAEELDALPGIGPVTAAKIIAARQETPFVSIDDLAQRDVVGASTLEKIRALITVAP
jgi:competence protein ComEA